MSPRRGVAPAAAHERVLDHLRPIDPRPRKPEVERTGHRGLGPACVWGPVAPGVHGRTARSACAAEAPPSAAASTIHSADSREAGRLTQSSRRAAAQPEGAIPLRPVADHACRPCSRPCRARRRSARPAPDTALAPRCRRRSSRPGSRSRRAPRRPRRARPCCGRRSSPLPRVRLRDPRARARPPPRGRGCRGCVAPANWTRSERAARSRPAFGRAPRSSGTVTSAVALSRPASARTPARPRHASVRPGRLSLASSQDSSAPIQVTGWPRTR